VRKCFRSGYKKVQTETVDEIFLRGIFLPESESESSKDDDSDMNDAPAAADYGDYYISD
jgi:hypothetical protein